MDAMLPRMRFLLVLLFAVSCAAACGGTTAAGCTEETTEAGCNKPGCAYVMTEGHGPACRDICTKTTCLDGTCVDDTPVVSTHPSRLHDVAVCLLDDDGPVTVD